MLCFSTCTHIHTHIITVHRLISSWSPSPVPLYEQTPDQATDTGNWHARAGYVRAKPVSAVITLNLRIKGLCSVMLTAECVWLG